MQNERIFILRPEDMPMAWRGQLSWQKEQEDNLLYVALTRSKSELFVVGIPVWLPKETEENTTVNITVNSVQTEVVETAPEPQEATATSMTPNRAAVVAALTEQGLGVLSDRALGKRLGVSATFVGQVRQSLEADGVIDAQSKRIDRSGRKLETENIGAKLKPVPSLEEEFWDRIQLLPTNELRRYRFLLDELIDTREDDEF